MSAGVKAAIFVGWTLVSISALMIFGRDLSARDFVIIFGGQMALIVAVLTIVEQRQYERDVRREWRDAVLRAATPDPDPASWIVAHTDDLTCHVYPLGDLIWHLVPGGGGGDECSCEPAIEPVPVADGRIGAVIVHRALDGREQYGTVPND